jgi:3-hydroxybutyryl-CoA dehydrogenase
MAAIKHGVKTLAVVGASGQMGNGIAYVAATQAHIPRILICDQSEAQLDKGIVFFEKLLAKDVSKSKLTQEQADRARASLVKIEGTHKLAEYQEGPPDLVIEAATENLQVKQSIFKTLASTLPLSTILATNTSSISVSKIAASAVDERMEKGSKEAWQSPARVSHQCLPTKESCSLGTEIDHLSHSIPIQQTIGLHFFNPVPFMKLVELIPALQTSEEVTARARAFAEACGKTITQSADTPGFVSNRLLVPFINEGECVALRGCQTQYECAHVQHVKRILLLCLAIIALETGVATKEDIDTTLKLGMRHPMGPLELSDFIGNDTVHAIAETLARETGDSKYRPSVLVSPFQEGACMRQLADHSSPFPEHSCQEWWTPAGTVERAARVSMITIRSCRASTTLS